MAELFNSIESIKLLPQPSNETQGFFTATNPQIIQHQSDISSLFSVPSATDNPFLEDKNFENLLLHGNIGDLLHYIGAIYTTPSDGRVYVRRSDGKYISNQYIRASIVEANPFVFQRCGKELTQAAMGLGLNPDIVVGSQLGGIKISGKVAELLGKPSTYLEKSNNGSMKFTERHNVDLTDQKVLVIEDEIKSEDDLKDIINIITSRGGEIIGIGCVFNTLRKESRQLSDSTVPIFSNYVPDEPLRYCDEQTKNNAKSLYSEQLLPNSIVEDRVKSNRSQITTYQQQYLQQKFSGK